jgi:hypothetical protein
VVALSPDAVVPNGRLDIAFLGTSGTLATGCDELACERGQVARLELLNRNAASTTVLDAGSEDAGPAPISPAPTPLLARLRLTPLSQSRGVVVLGQDCAALNTTDIVTIPAQSLTSDVFSICTNGRGGKFRLDAFLLADSSVSGSANVDIPEALQNVAFQTTSNSDAQTLHYTLCGGTDEVATTRVINISPRVGINVSNEQFMLDSDMTDDVDSGTGGAYATRKPRWVFSHTDRPESDLSPGVVQ